jgi:hypothetical protein
MAARGGGGSGMVVSVVILGVLALGLFITTIVFYSHKQAAEKRYSEQAAETRELIGEARSDAVNRYRDPARKEGKAVLAYLVAEAEKAAAERRTLQGQIREKDGQIAALTAARVAAEDARDRAQADRQNEARRVSEIEASQRAALASLTAEIDRLKDEVDKYRQDLNATKARMDQEVDKTREAARAKESELVAQIREAQEKQAIASDTVRRLQEQLRGKTYKPGDEALLVDGHVIGFDPGSNHYFIDIGRAQRVVLGMTFEVYSDAAALRPDERTGAYPPGKATLEVIRVEEGTSTCRLLREKRGNPVVKGDVIANAVFDPQKTYRFLIYGNFDANGDGVATPQEASLIEALIREWGGVVVPELTGDVDFLVLGERPALPPPPPPTAPPAVVQEYVRVRGLVNQYDRLFQQAEATSIPILNENRLRTLTGIGYRR